MAAPYSNLSIRLGFTSLSPVIDNASVTFNYFTTFTTQDITDVSDVVTNLTNALNAIPSGGVAKPGSYIAAVMSRATNASTVEVYDVTNTLNGSRHGSPVLLSAFTLPTAGSSAGLPEGCCAALTLQAPYGTDVEFGPGTRPRARDRGRIYWGPLHSGSTAVEGTTSRTVLSANCMGDLTKFIKAVNVRTTSPHSVVYNLGVWSRKNAAMKSLQEVWCDDRPDYQRRRADQGVNKVIVGLP